MAPGLDEFDVLLEVVLSLVRVRQITLNEVNNLLVLSDCVDKFSPECIH